MKIFFSLLTGLLFAFSSFAQEDTSDVEAVRRTIQLSEVVVRSDLNVPRFLQRIKNDSSYYKAFKNLHILGYTALNFIQMRDKKGKAIASLSSKTKQHVANGCRTMDINSAQIGWFYN